MNAFNKWPWNYDADFHPEDSSTHIGRVVQNAESLTRVLQIISQGIDGWASHELILARISSKEAMSPSSKKNTWSMIPPKVDSSTLDSLQPWEFVMIGEDKQWHDIYKYKIMTWGQTWKQVKHILVEKFNTQFDMTFRINETYIVDATKQPLSDNQRLKEWTVIYVTVPWVLKRMFD